MTIAVLDADGNRRNEFEPLPPGRANAAASRPITFSTEDLAAVNAITAALGTNHADEVQLHADIATTLHADLAQLHTDNSSTRPVSMADASNVTFGAKADAKSTATDTTAITAMQVLKQISFCLQALATGLAGTRVETTVAAGGTAANLFGATPTNGFEVINPHATETLYIRENGTATVADNSTSVAIPPKAAYTTPHGYKPIGDVSYIAATTGHAVIARRW